MEKIKKALMLTGAAARISQEVAIFDKLREKRNLNISQSDTLLVGSSSGALNIAALNACFRDVNPNDWESYYKESILFPLRNKDVYKNNSFPFIPIKDTAPLQDTLNDFLSATEMHTMKDLTFPSYVLTMLQNKDNVSAYDKYQTLWAHSKDIDQQNIKLENLLMATTAIPVVFPAQEIKADGPTNFPQHSYYDGGTLGTFNEFEEHIGKLINAKGESLEELYIISPMRERSNEEVNIELDSIGSVLGDKILDEIKDFLCEISIKSFMRFLEALAEWNKKNMPIAKSIFVCIPEMNERFPILDFDQEKEQYDTVSQWIDENPNKLAIPLDEFIKSHRGFLI